MKMKKLKLFCSVLAVCMSANLTCHAAEPIFIGDILAQKYEEDQIDTKDRSEMISYGAPCYRDDFDYDWYLKMHPDVAAAFGNDRDAIWNWYITTGEPAGWYGRCSKNSLILVGAFDLDRFAAENPDIVEMYGENYVFSAYYYWYCYGQYEGRTGYSVSKEDQAKMKAFEIGESITTPDMSDREKVKVIHDWICKNVAYDYDNYLAGTIAMPSYGVEGVIDYQCAVCSGYAKTFDIMAHAAGLLSYEVDGTTKRGPHAWNRVLVDGTWFNIDVTWDDPVPDHGYGNVARYKYFLVSDDFLAQDHKW